MRALLHRTPLVLFAVFSAAASGQTQTTGGVQGYVHRSGYPELGIAAAIVEILNQETGLRRTTLTGADGSYLFTTLPPGSYTVTAHKTGYIPDPAPALAAVHDFPVHLSKVEIVQLPPIALQPIDLKAVPSPVPAGNGAAERLVNTVNATHGANFEARQLRALPIAGTSRTIDMLALLVPGVFPPPEPIGSTVGPGIGPGIGTSGEFSVNGLRSRSNTFTIDGSDNDDSDIGVRRQGFTALVSQPVESVQEFQVGTALPEPQFGRTGGAIANAVSRSGANTFHGSAYGFFTSSALRARDYFDMTGGPAQYAITRTVAKEPVLDAVVDTPDTTPFHLGDPILLDGKPLMVSNPLDGKTKFRNWIGGALLGGAIVRNKAHFFLAFEQAARRAEEERHFSVPTIAERGIFGSGETGFLKDEHELLFGITRFVGLGPVSPFGQTVFSLFPFPNNPVGPYGRNTYSSQLPNDATARVGSARFDQDNLDFLGRPNALSLRYNIADDATDLPVAGGALFSSMRAPVRSHDAALNLSTVLTPTSTNQLRVSFGRTESIFEELRNPFLSRSNYGGYPFLLNAKQVGFVGSRETTYQSLDGDTEMGFGGYCSRTFDSLGIGAGDCTGPLGQVIVSGYSPIGPDVNNFPQQRSTSVFQVADTFMRATARHRLTAGFDIRRTRSNSQVDRLFRPVAVFSGAIDIAAQHLSSTGSTPGIYLGRDFAAAGAPTSFTQTLSNYPDSEIGLRSWEIGLFIGDQFRLTRRLMVTMGAIWRLNTVPVDSERRIERSFSSPEIQDFIAYERSVYGVSGLETFLAGRKALYNGDWGNIGPQISFAYNLGGDGRTSVRGGYGVFYDRLPGAVMSLSRNVYPNYLPIDLAGVQVDTLFSDAFGPQFVAGLVATNPALFFTRKGTLNLFDTRKFSSFGQLLKDVSRPDPATGELLTAAAPSFVLPERNLRTPGAQQWNLGIEREVRGDLVVAASYVGTMGKHLLGVNTPNGGPNRIPVVTSIIATGIFEEGLSVIGRTTNPDRPYPLLGALTLITAGATSSYHSLQLEARHRFGQSISFDAGYTWSHAIDDVSDIFDLAGAPALPQNYRNLRAERASANFDIRQRLTGSFVWDVPLWRRRNYLGGWQLAGISTVASGQPYTLLADVDVNQDGNLTDRINTTAGIQVVDRGATRLQMPQNFLTLLAPPGKDGAIGRNTFRGPGLIQIDCALVKRFLVSESERAEVRAEAFNVANRAQFALPVNVVDSPAAGHSVATRSPGRTVQFALKLFF